MTTSLFYGLGQILNSQVAVAFELCDLVSVFQTSGKILLGLSAPSYTAYLSFSDPKLNDHLYVGFDSIFEILLFKKSLRGFCKQLIFMKTVKHIEVKRLLL